MAVFLQNTWYMAAWSNEVSVGSTFTRRILDTPLVLFRTSDGSPVILVDRCPHRFAPLSRGIIKDDTIQCGYHGLCFDKAGACVKNPQGPAPAAARVRSYPAVEQDGIIWFWAGEPGRADPIKIPRFPQRLAPDYRTLNGLTLVKAHYELCTDNLLDLTHVSFLHPAFGGSDWDPKQKVVQKGNTIWSNYDMFEFPNSDYGKAIFPHMDGSVDERDSMRWDPPSVLRFEIGIVKAGAPAESVRMIADAHILSPETESTTHYFWSTSVPAESPISDEQLLGLLTQAFDREDRPMLEAVDSTMERREFWSLKPILLRGDEAAVRARRVVAKLLDEDGRTEPERKLTST